MSECILFVRTVLIPVGSLRQLRFTTFFHCPVAGLMTTVTFALSAAPVITKGILLSVTGEISVKLLL
jgi:hypothetical protein